MHLLNIIWEKRHPFYITWQYGIHSTPSKSTASIQHRLGVRHSFYTIWEYGIHSTSKNMASVLQHLVVSHSFSILLEHRCHVRLQQCTSSEHTRPVVRFQAYGIRGASFRDPASIGHHVAAKDLFQDTPSYLYHQCKIPSSIVQDFMQEYSGGTWRPSVVTLLWLGYWTQIDGVLEKKNEWLQSGCQRP